MWEFLVLLAGVISTPVLAISYVPQIVKIHTTKDASSQSLSFWLILDISLACFFILAFDGFLNNGEWVLALAQAVNLLLASIVTVQTVVYQKTDASAVLKNK